VNTRNMKVRARLKDNNINPGTFVKVLFDKKSEGILVPSNALIPDANSNQVVVIRSKKAMFINVETGTRNADMIELTSGINPGDTVVVTGVLFVRPNVDVTIRKVKTGQLVSNDGETVSSKK
jgi:membrane fusion protein, multidrug efflux system